MCIAAPGKVTKVEGKKAYVKYPGGEERQAFISDIKPKVGDSVLVQMGIILEIVSASKARYAAKAWG